MRQFERVYYASPYLEGRDVLAMEPSPQYLRAYVGSERSGIQLEDKRKATVQWVRAYAAGKEVPPFARVFNSGAKVSVVFTSDGKPTKIVLEDTDKETSKHTLLIALKTERRMPGYKVEWEHYQGDTVLGSTKLIAIALLVRN